MKKNKQKRNNKRNKKKRNISPCSHIWWLFSSSRFRSFAPPKKRKKREKRKEKENTPGFVIHIPGRDIEDVAGSVEARRVARLRVAVLPAERSTQRAPRLAARRLCFARIRLTRKIVTHGVILHTFEVTFFVSRFDDLVPYQHRKVILWSQLPLPSASHRLLVHPFLCCIGV